MKNAIAKTLVPALTLAGMGLGAALLVGVVGDVTEPQIEQRRQEDLTKTLTQVIPKDIHDNNLAQSQRTVAIDGQETTIYRAKQATQTSAVAFHTVAPQGYAGPIELLLAVQPDGTLLGVRVLSHAETPGLGDQIEVEKSNWIRGFEGKSIDNPPPEAWNVKKDGGVFDAFTGATITPRAVVFGVRDGLLRFHANKELFLGAPSADGGTPCTSN